MRFKEFLFEREIDSFDSVIRQIRANCQPFIKTGRTLYRGIPVFGARGEQVEKLDFERAHYTPHPIDRAAKNSSPFFNFMFNAGCELAFGEVDIRKSTIFATNDVHMAKLFGEVMFFFPAGEFKFLISEHVQDSFENSDKIRTTILHHLGVPPRAGLRQGFDALAKHYKSPHKWVTEADKALAITQEAFHTDDEKFYFTLKEAMTAAFKDLYVDTPQLSHFNLNGHEILFYHTHGYYSIPATMVMNEMSKRGVEHAGVEEDEAIKKFLREFIAGKHDAL